MEKLFITGTDTDIGKTFVCKGLCLKYKKENKNVGYFKPFQSGAFEDDNKLIAPDVFELEKYGIQSSYSYLVKGEISPYLASKFANIDFDIEKVKKDIEVFSKDKDIVIIEGAGGLYCPIKPKYTFLDFIKELDIETIVVTTPDLGRINHTLMTLELMKKANIKIKGLIINKMPISKSQAQENFIEELKTFSDVEILDVIPETKNDSEDEIIKAFN